MNNAIYNFREPKNEQVLSYKTGSVERELLEEELANQKNKVIDIPLIIGGKEIRTGKTGTVVMPTDHHHVLATYHMATEKEVAMAAEAAMSCQMRMDDTFMDGKSRCDGKGSGAYLKEIQVCTQCSYNARTGEKCDPGRDRLSL